MAGKKVKKAKMGHQKDAACRAQAQAHRRHRLEAHRQGRIERPDPIHVGGRAVIELIGGVAAVLFCMWAFAAFLDRIGRR